ncbi:alkaline phosphatase-like [Acanthaster planci]|uniref:Alkaline phosphatase n=1 Tax=Acanthaster planci TaxID=133434 RepID=A0A8B7XR35_ACAPL|nr:alkaline phosphatase-like [Acanthaster planci]
MACRVLQFGLLATLFFLTQHETIAADETTPQYWYDRSQVELDAALVESQGFNTNRAEGMILFIGDGMSVSTVTGVRIWKGQKAGNTGEESKLVYDDFPHFGYSKTYNTDSQVPDSAGTATAYLTGVKTKRRVLGLDAGIQVKNCNSISGHEVDSILAMVKKNGLPVGIVTTTRITHASPGGAYAHVPHRSWEDDSELPQEAVDNGCKDIAKQLVKDHDIDVILGGGRRRFLMKSQQDETGWAGARSDEDLIAAWKAKYANKASAEYITTRDQLLTIDPDDTEYLLGLFGYAELNFDISRTAKEPTLAEMTEMAIRILQKKSTDGRYFLFVEGGRVDHGHHYDQAKFAITDGLALEAAIAKAKELTTPNTLIALSSDHSHTLSFAGYPKRGNPIFGKIFSDSYNLPYTTLSYYSGRTALLDVALSFRFNGHRPDVTNVDTEKKSYAQQALVGTYSATHSGEDVAIFATGPWSHLFHSVHEQNYIPHVMMFAGCVGDYYDTCRDSPLISGSLTAEDAAVPARFRYAAKPKSFTLV